jgi:hypothetical protein
MATIITRTKGGTAKNSPLTNEEVDDNFINLNTDKQENLVSGTNIKTVGSESLLGFGDIPLNIAAISGLATALSDKQATLVSGTNIKTINGVSIVGSGDMTVATSEIPASQAEMEAGTEAGLRSMSPLRVKQAIAALGGGGGVPPGTIIDYAGTSAPDGYLICGIAPTTLSRTVYADLFAAIGTTWGAGNGSTTFGLPWFPADYTTMQSNSNVGTSSVGAVISHAHAGGFSAQQAATAGASSYWAGLVSANTEPAGGSANYAAGVRVLKCVKY